MARQATEQRRVLKMAVIYEKRRVAYCREHSNWAQLENIMTSERDRWGPYLSDRELVNAKHESNYPLGTPLTHGVTERDRRVSDAATEKALTAQAARITALEGALGVADSVVKALALMEHANGRRYCTLCGAWDGEAHGDDCLHSDYLRARALLEGEKGR